MPVPCVDVAEAAYCTRKQQLGKCSKSKVSNRCSVTCNTCAAKVPSSSNVSALPSPPASPPRTYGGAVAALGSKECVDFYDPAVCKRKHVIGKCNKPFWGEVCRATCGKCEVSVGEPAAVKSSVTHTSKQSSSSSGGAVIGIGLVGVGSIAMGAFALMRRCGMTTRHSVRLGIRRVHALAEKAKPAAPSIEMATPSTV